MTILPYILAKILIFNSLSIISLWRNNLFIFPFVELNNLFNWLRRTSTLLWLVNWFQVRYNMIEVTIVYIFISVNLLLRNIQIYDTTFLLNGPDGFDWGLLEACFLFVGYFYHHVGLSAFCEVLLFGWFTFVLLDFAVFGSNRSYFVAILVITVLTRIFLVL